MTKLLDRAIEAARAMRPEMQEVCDGRTGARHLGEAWPVKLRYTRRGAAELTEVLA